VGDVITKNFADPDSREEVPLGLVELVRMGSLTVGRETLYPGWRWSTHIRSIVGTDLCEFHHIGIQVSGRWICESRDGTQTEIGPGDVYDIAPGHDSWVVGDEPAVNIDFQGVAGWALPPAPGERVLTTILFTDIADSTAAAERMGDRRWTALLAQHLEDVRQLLSVHRGHEVKVTGDGFLATFDRPAAAVRCAAAIADSAGRLGLAIRAGVHTGEVELAGDDLRGVAVHLAARVMDAAAPGEVLVSSTTRDLVAGTDLEFEEKGSFNLKGISGARTLYALTADPA
jgi:class 3 adenylate cyclase